jgi:peptidoglycan hydrolase-like protein with peptidoglycan-binding domain
VPDPDSESEPKPEAETTAEAEAEAHEADAHDAVTEPETEAHESETEAHESGAHEAEAEAHEAGAHEAVTESETEAHEVETAAHQPAHAARSRLSARQRSALLVALGLVVVAAAGVGVALAVSGPGDETSTAGRPSRTTEAPATTAETTTTTAPTTTTTAPPETTTTLPPETTTTLPPPPEADGTLELGEGGDAVAALQQRLVDLGYWLGEPDGSYGQLTRQAVMAFQKVEGLGRDGVAGPVTQERLAVGGRPTPRGGSGLEIDLDRQVLFVVDGGAVRWAINTSTGNGEAYTSSSGGSAVAATPPGHYEIRREIDGLREAPLGTLYRPKYFNGGIAIHGSGSIPAQPASHGCARVTNSAMDMLWATGVAVIGTPVWVY